MSAIPSPTIAKVLKVAGIVFIPSALYLLWRRLNKSPPDAGPASIPLYGEARSRLEKFIFIESQYVGVVLGRHLRNLRALEHETRTFINLISLGTSEIYQNVGALQAYEDASSTWDNEDELPTSQDQRVQFLRVHAQTAEQIKLVELAIEAMIDDAKRRRSTGQFRIPADTVGYVIGKKGERIRKISRQFRVHMVISQDGGDYETVSVEGTPEGINDVQEYVLKIVEKHSMNNNNNGLEQSAEEQIKEMIALKEQLENVEEFW